MTLLEPIKKYGPGSGSRYNLDLQSAPLGVLPMIKCIHVIVSYNTTKRRDLYYY